jgi:hypothetical protein
MMLSSYYAAHVLKHSQILISKKMLYLLNSETTHDIASGFEGSYLKYFVINVVKCKQSSILTSFHTKYLFTTTVLIAKMFR